MSVTQDFCNRVKCGATNAANVSPSDLFACSQQYGAGVYGPCDPRCLQYGLCAQRAAAPISASGVQTFSAPIQITPHALTPQSLVRPVPDLSALYPAQPVAPVEQSLWCKLNAAIQDSPVSSVLVLIGAFLLLKGTGK